MLFQGGNTCIYSSFITSSKDQTLYFPCYKSFHKRPLTSKNAFSIRQHIEYRTNFGPKKWLRLMRVINIYRYDRYTALYLSLSQVFPYI